MNIRNLEIGPKVEAVQHHHAKMPDRKPGEHLWVMTAAWRVRPEPNKKYHLDTESLLTIDGPGCYWCEEMWEPGMELRPCRGHGR